MATTGTVCRLRRCSGYCPGLPTNIRTDSSAWWQQLPPVRAVHDAAVASWALVRDFAEEMRSNLSDPITPLLATGALASALLGSPLDAVLVGSVLLVNAALSAEQQLHAERILNRLLAVQEPPARRGWAHWKARWISSAARRCPPRGCVRATSSKSMPTR